MPAKRPRDARWDPEEPKRGDSRTGAQRDRDRILYSSAFRRLAEVTQVVAPENTYVFHNRLTHSLEVAQVARRIAEKLSTSQKRRAQELGGIDPDVVEAAALAHDLGHPPFGHVAEEELREVARRRRLLGGFEGNAQSFRIVTKLASRSRGPGLNLTRATLAAMAKYPWLRARRGQRSRKWGAYDSEKNEFRWAITLFRGSPGRRCPEAEIMDWADDVTYSVHDLDDFYRAGRIPLHLLATPQNSTERDKFFQKVFERRKREGGIWRRVDDLERAFAGIMEVCWVVGRTRAVYLGTQDERFRMRGLTSVLINRYVNAIRLLLPKGRADRAVEVDPNAELEVAILKELTWHYIIEDPGMAAQQEGQRRVVRGLADIFHEAALHRHEWRLFPAYYQEKLHGKPTAGGTTRLILDLVASMTERQAVTMYQRLTGISLGSALEHILQ